MRDIDYREHEMSLLTQDTGEILHTYKLVEAVDAIVEILKKHCSSKVVAVSYSCNMCLPINKSYCTTLS